MLENPGISQLQSSAQAIHEEPSLEMSVSTALELQRLQLACLIDIRQNFELEIYGEIPGACALPFFHFKKLLGQPLFPMEQDTLDEDVPDLRDIQHFLSMINGLHFTKDFILVCVCNSGHRSLDAARLMRLLGYGHAFSLTGGYRALKEVLDKKLEAVQSIQESKEVEAG